MSTANGYNSNPTRRAVLAVSALGLVAGAPTIGRAAPQDQLTWGVHISLAPVWFDPADISGNIIQAGPGAFGNAATRIESLIVKGGTFAYGSYPDIDALYRQQAIELNRGRREAILHKIQQLIYERTIYAPIWQLAFINGVGPRVGESGFGRIARFPYTAPYEDITLKAA